VKTAEEWRVAINGGDACDGDPAENAYFEEEIRAIQADALETAAVVADETTHDADLIAKLIRKLKPTTGDPDA
jgi:hypothetical protein